MQILNLKKQTLHLHPLKAIFWEEKRALLLADLHLGKAAHFRKKGLAVSPAVADENFKNLETLIALFSPERVFFLGDLFHSSLNKSWERFSLFLGYHSDISFELVQGNHDILPEAIYEESAMKVYTEPYIIKPFIFSHFPLEEFPVELYNFYGHLHPSVILEGAGKQVLKLPCFHFGKMQSVMPAFGSFTGTAVVRPKAGDTVFVVADGEVIRVA